MSSYTAKITGGSSWGGREIVQPLDEQLDESLTQEKKDKWFRRQTNKLKKIHGDSINVEFVKN